MDGATDGDASGRETTRRIAQHAAAVAVVSAVGGFVVMSMARIDGIYREESSALLLWVLSLASLLVWCAASVAQHRRRRLPGTTGPRGFDVIPPGDHTPAGDRCDQPRQPSGH